MIADTHVRRRDSEVRFVESLRDRYEREGFAFTAHPDAAQLPGFLGTYSPDALAQKPGRNVLIEVKRRQGPSADLAPLEIRRLIDGHSEWHLDVVFMGTDPLPAVEIPTVEARVILDRLDEVRALMAQGFPGPAFIMVWSLLEAAFRATNGAGGSTATPATIVQMLAIHGQIEPATERRLDPLIELRNRIVHGDLTARPTDADVELMLSAVKETLSAEATSV